MRQFKGRTLFRVLEVRIQRRTFKPKRNVVIQDHSRFVVEELHNYYPYQNIFIK
jgi:hypothetical protein